MGPLPPAPAECPRPPVAVPGGEAAVRGRLRGAGQGQPPTSVLPGTCPRLGTRTAGGRVSPRTPGPGPGVSGVEQTPRVTRASSCPTPRSVLRASACLEFRLTSRLKESL